MPVSSTYVALIEKEPATLYSVWFPDLPGCISAGETLEEAAKNAIEAARLWAADAFAAGEDLPAARTIDELAINATVALSLDGGAVPIWVSLADEMTVRLSAAEYATLRDASDAAAHSRAMAAIASGEEKTLTSEEVTALLNRVDYDRRARRRD